VLFGKFSDSRGEFTGSELPEVFFDEGAQIEVNGRPAFMRQAFSLLRECVADDPRPLA
jgi:hypothetical protein